MKFKVGDKVKWYKHVLGEYRATIIRFVNSKRCLLHWSHELNPRECELKFLILLDYYWWY